ncbi:hypothetical protein [Neotabrizicola shimadae]|uniref:Uncharacterized protein n=1 Tax=Neotabrizicola shimadae TaxID=2807096 RepID=A0A8G1ED03_9RHOB|nr:hypothetical protein [Neotabrizicola shimadae]QYZ69643.1 hypothetical protein JO391_18395 [Neotabrizicola shimadae]
MMSRHLADHRSPPRGTRAKEFLRIEREELGRLWQQLFRRPVPVPVTGRRTAEFCRIDRGRSA